ncbi:tRNA(His) guanylyltransferase Thg1 family protein [Vibrio crassostreae]|uniref:tRNA(His) guanylyltransferase Thg1 family protein n=1 Tax=Vibrio crassostreae TaxID=246167 RepID=UPI001B3090FE|nr:tRNA(His) guanylyltransferase Thg1 family protein [Vibrio crassostreae]
MDKTSLGDRIKLYEAATDQFIIPHLPVVVRLDGRSFSTFTKGFNRPFDTDFREAMIEVAKYLVQETHAKIAYTQSDEITLIYSTNSPKQRVFFEGRVQKICSVFAGLAASRFLLEVQKRWSHKLEGSPLPTFDCRAFYTPNEIEAYNAILWREQDATKNSIQMAARAEFTHGECKNLNTKQLQAKLLKERDINWNNYTSGEKRGTYIRKEKVERVLSSERLALIPEDKRPVGGKVMRNEIVIMDMPPIMKVDNAVDVIFRGENPRLRTG